jgi:hypothetical protein
VRQIFWFHLPTVPDFKRASSLICTSKIYLISAIYTRHAMKCFVKNAITIFMISLYSYSLVTTLIF